MGSRGNPDSVSTTKQDGKMTVIVSAILYTVAVLIAILLVALVLVQPSKGGGFGSAFGGVGEGVFGAQTMGYLSRLTVVLITVFFVVTLALAAVSGHRQKVSAAASSSAALSSAVETKAAPAVAEKAPAAPEKNEKNAPEAKK
ncbi:MAG TPA: preprotein translocase subunit SecG [Lentisphaeria bacterium]|nr:preprotein translocase subunit SecG [Lentisphaeria bacterium]